MAKKKKLPGKGAASRRGKRGKQAEDNDTINFDGETSTFDDSQSSSQEPGGQSPSIIPTTSTEPSNTQETSTSQASQCDKLKQIPTVLLHKKFGKYRCLFSDTDSGKKYDLGSDSETNSSLDIRVVDPCASSESDSNAALDGRDANKPCAVSLDSIPLPPMNRDAPDLVKTQCMPIAEVISIPESIPLPESIPVHLDDIPLPPTRKDLLENQEIQLPSEPPPIISVSEIPLPVYTIPTKEKPDKAEGVLVNCKDLLKKDTTEKIQEIVEEPNLQDISEMSTEKAEVSVTSMETEQEEQDNEDIGDDDDDEVITVVQIVEDGESTEYYYNLEDSISNEINESEKETRDFQQHFKDLKLDAKETNISPPMDCSDNKTAEPCLPIIERLSRPDPSLTPSSTLSDDSNCSRLNSVQNSDGSAESSPTGVRRSSRLKTITSVSRKSKGLVKTPLKKALLTQAKMKLEEFGSDSQERPPDFMAPAGSGSPTFPVPIDMPVKVKSRWRRSSELDLMANSPSHSPLASPGLPNRLPSLNETGDKDEESEPLSKEAYDKIIEERMNQYDHLVENEYLCERMVSRDTKKMICDCFLTKEELDRGERGCGEDCLNRLLMIECNSRCPVGDRCTNRRFQKIQNGPLRVFYADKKGCGVEAAEDISPGKFLMEYVGEVLDYDLFYKRAQAYSDENNMHHYFMSLKGDTVIDATSKGNISRFINHSCEPNAETQKWTVNGELRIGFFSKRDIKVGEEITFDYQFQRFGKEAQRCYCGAENCRGWIGAEPDSDDEYYEEEDDVSTSKSLTETSEKSLDTSLTGRPDVVRVRKPRRERRKFAVTKPDLVQDADIEEDIEVLSRTGIKNQSHTLRLSRSMVRAKSRPAQTALLRLLRDADLPCRRLFLDYRGLRLLAPWCADAPLHFKLEMLQAVDRLPIPNKTMVVESRFISVVEKWLTAADAEVANVFIDEATGLPVELKTVQDAATDKPKDASAISEKLKELGKQLLERWSSLKEIFKIPKKERIQQMKEHERQANVERRAADSSGSRERSRDDRERDRERTRDDRRDDRRDDYRDKHRDRDRERDRDRDRDRERERDDRDRRKRRSSPEGRRSIRLTDRVLAAVPPMSKEERRRAFAEAAAAAEETRRQNDAQWAQWEAYAQMFPPGMMPPNMLPPNMMNIANMPNMPPNMANMPPNMANLPPNMANMPPNMANMPPNMANMPPNMANMPPNMTNIPPNMANMPNMASMGNMPPNMPNMANMPPNMANMPPGMTIPTNVPGMPPNMANMGGPMMGPMGIMGPEMGQDWMAQTGDFQGQGFPPQFQPQFMMHQPNFMGMNNFGMAGMPPGMPPGMMYPQTQPAFPNQEPPPTQQPHDMAMEQDDGKEVVLPPLWRSALDDRGQTYYYHVKLRQPQWVPPPYEPTAGGDSSSSDEEDMSPEVEATTMVRRTKGKVVEGLKGIYEVIKEDSHNGLIPDHALVNVKPRKRRPGLVCERPISPRTEEDKLAGRLEVKRYKETKEKLRRRRERLLQKFQLLQNATRKKHRELTPKDLQMADLVDTDSDTSSSSPEPPAPSAAASAPAVSAPVSAPASASPTLPVPDDDDEPILAEEVDADEVARRIKESFRSCMARVMVHHLNPYRHRTAPFGRITNTADFKHLARKLTHFVMLKELKHCRTVEELVVTDSVRSKAKEFVKKYMAKFGTAYKRPAEEAD